MLAVCSRKSMVIWNAVSWERMLTLEDEDLRFWRASFLPDGKHAVLLVENTSKSNETFELCLLNVASGALEKRTPMEIQCIECRFAISPSSLLVAIPSWSSSHVPGSKELSVTVLRIDDFTALQEITFGPDRPEPVDPKVLVPPPGYGEVRSQTMPFAVAFSPNGDFLAIDTAIPGFYDVLTGKMFAKFWSNETCGGNRSFLNFTNDGRTLISHLAADVVLYDLESKVDIARIRGHHLYCSAVSPDGSLLATGCQDESVLLWDLPAIIDAARAQKAEAGSSR